MVASRLMGAGKSVADAKRENGRERDDGSHHMIRVPLSTQAFSMEKGSGAFRESQVCHIRA